MNEFYASRSPEVEKREVEHAELSRKLAGECMVLLENDGVLPIHGTGNIALFGSGVRKTVKGGTGSGDVNTRSNVNVEQGFLNAGFTITTTDWLDRQDKLLDESKAAYLAETERIAREKGCSPFVAQFDHPYKEPAPVPVEDSDCENAKTSCAIYVISRNSGEGADRFCKEGDYLLYRQEKENLKKLVAHFEKTIVVLNIGGVMDLTQLKKIQGISAILLMNQLGNIGGDALVDVITGKVTPSGKTTDTWAKSYMDYPSSADFSHNGSVDDEYYTDGIYVGYRYFDTFGVKPEYCFGFGRSYTEFSIAPKQVTVDKDKVSVQVLVKNTGDTYAGKEVVQVYYAAPDGALEKPARELVAFAKTSLLQPAQEETLELSFALEEMASYSEQEAAWLLEAGDYTVLAGNSSDNLVPVAVLHLGEEIKTRQCKNLFVLDCELKEIAPSAQNKGDTKETLTKLLHQAAQENFPVFQGEIRAGEIPTVAVDYQQKRVPYTTDQKDKLTMQNVLDGTCTVEELVAQLSVEELAEMCVGTLRADGGSVVGNASHTVPGAAGDTSSVLKQSRGVKNMIFADGPAGLRLQPHFKTTKQGEILPGGDIMGDTMVPFPTDLKDEDVDDYYQYCTAIPIGWALAQSWNTELVEQAGDTVGSEMEQFHVDLWLAPAMNIHRNPLCGRNFEYYSEDPLISGKMAAAITKGVQKHHGKGTTIKHFAVNNQEDNRYFVNAHVGERALREIYLKGFEIAVKESQPLSIMTSYNLLNGEHTANSHDLIQAMARDEWGFEGTVMTDWFTSQHLPALTGKFKPKYPISASTGCIYAGNDIQMPGCQKNVDDIVKAVTEGKAIDGYQITLADLQYNAANVIRVVARTM